MYILRNSIMWQKRCTVYGEGSVNNWTWKKKSAYQDNKRVINIKNHSTPLKFANKTMEILWTFLAMFIIFMSENKTN